MGLFGSIFKGVVGAIPVIGSAVSGQANKKAVKKANAATQLGIQQAQTALNTNYATAQGNFAPYMAQGVAAAGKQSDLLGLNGDGAQGGSIDALKASPLFQSIFNTGQEAILQSASATGGLRGGNLETGLAEFGSNTLAQVIQQQLGNLGGLAQQGLGATSNLASLGANNANAIAGLYGQSGSANAGSILGQQNIENQTTQQIAGQIQSLIAGATGGGGGVSSAISGATSIAPNVDITALLKKIGSTPIFGGGTQGNVPGVLSLANASGGSIFRPGGF